MKKWAYKVSAWVSFGMACIGAILPLIPCTPFLLLSLWLASRADPRFATWLVQHPKWGVAIRTWQRNRSISFRHKWIAISMLMVNWIVLWLFSSPTLVLVISAVCSMLVISFLVRLPTAQSGSKPYGQESTTLLKDSA